MNTNNFAIKFKRYAVLGISLLGLAAMGCGGGSGTLVSDPTFGIPAPATPSLQTTAGAKKSLATISTGSLTVYSLDGAILAPATSVTLPHTVTVSGSLKTKAAAQGALVVRINNDAGVDYTTVVKLDASDLAANGPIVDADGTSRQEPVDPKSTVRTALIEAELERETGQVVRLGTVASAEVQLALGNVVSNSNTGSNAVAVGAIADSLKAAAAEPGSLISILSQEADTASTSTGVNAQDSIRNFLTKGTSSSLKSARRLMKASTKLSRQARKRDSAAAKSFLANLAKSTPAEAAANAAGASVVAAALDLSDKEASLKDQAEALLTAADLQTAVAEAAANVLPLITTELAVSLNSQNASDEIAELVGGVIAGSTDTIDEGLATLNLVIAVADTTTKKKLFGASLAATADNTAAAKELIQNVASDELSVSDAINAVSADVDVADVVDVVADVITALDGGSLAGLDNTVDALVNGLQNLDGDDLAAIAANTDYDAADAACLKGFSCGAADGTLTVKTNDLVSLFNSSIFGTGTYTYAWTVASGVGTGITSSADQLEFTAAGSGAVTLTQSLAGVEINTFTLNLTVLTTLKPVVELDSDELRIKPGKSGSLLANIFDAEGRELQSAVAVKNCDGTAATGFTKAISESGLVTVSAAADTATGVYCGTVTATPTTGDSQVETFDVHVEGYGPTVLTLSGVSDTTTGTVSNITLTGFSEDPNASGTLTLSILSGVTTVATTTVAIAAGSVSTSISVTNDTIGTFQVTGTAEGADEVNAVYNVKAVGAPDFTAVTANGLPVRSGSTFQYTVSAGGTVSVTVSASATATDATITGYTLEKVDPDTGVTIGQPIPSTVGVLELTGLGAGSHILVVKATDDNSKSVERAFEISVTELKEFMVTGVSLSGVTTNTLTTAMSGGKYVVDASGVEGLSLDNSGLKFTITGASTVNTFDSSYYSVEVKLITPGTDLREASIEITGATIAAGQTGYDLTSATQLILKATKADGVTKGTYTASSSAITNFGALFAESAHGLEIDIAELKNAIKTDVISNAGSFYQSLDTLTGSGLTVEVTINAPQFSFKSGNYNFNTFVINNITVE